MASAPDPAQSAFEQAMREFREKLADEALYKNLLETTTIGQVYEKVDEIQEEQSKRRTMRNLAKIRPFLDGLKDYAASVEVFVQVKPDVMALIWGPIKLLLQWTSVLAASFDAIIDTFAEIGRLLPEFKRMTSLFNDNAALRSAMVLFFSDILDFYLIALKFFKKTSESYSDTSEVARELAGHNSDSCCLTDSVNSLRQETEMALECLWPRQRKDIASIVRNVQQHASLMRSEVQQKHVEDGHKLRLETLRLLEAEGQERRTRDFDRIQTHVAPRLYHSEYEFTRNKREDGAEDWLMKNNQFSDWLKTGARSAKLLWLQGIPGAGKTFLVSSVVDKVQSMGAPGRPIRAAYAFLSYKEKPTVTAASVLLSFAFSLASDDPDLHAVICDSYRKEVRGNVELASEFLTTLLACAGPSYIIMDGLDEIEPPERKKLLQELVRVSESSDNLKILISCRPYADIKQQFPQKTSVIRVEHNNLTGIDLFVQRWAKKLCEDNGLSHDQQVQMQSYVQPVAAMSEGMFLYARVVLAGIDMFSGSFENIREGLKVLPDSLDQAYERIFNMIDQSPPHARMQAHLVLGWLACTPTPLTAQEVLHLLATDAYGVGRRTPLMPTSDVFLVNLCKSLIETNNGHVQFIHFTVQEYITSPKGAVDVSHASMQLAIRCVAHLNQPQYGPHVANREVYRGILAGDYVLSQYASSWWAHLAKGALDLESPHEQDLCDVLKQLMYDRWRHDTHTLAPQPPLECSDLEDFLDRALEYRKSLLASESSASSAGAWVAADPTVISDTIQRVEAQTEIALGRDRQGGESAADQASRLKSMGVWYGSHPFKCRYFHCVSSRRGFENAASRASHESSHAKPWRCAVVGCEYAEGGFLSASMRDAHLARAHRPPVDPKPRQLEAEYSAKHYQSMNLRTVRSFLADLIRQGTPSNVASAMEALTSCRLSETRWRRRGGRLVRRKLPLSAQGDATRILNWIVSGKQRKADNDKYEYYDDDDYDEHYPLFDSDYGVPQVISALIRSNDTGMFDLWIPHLGNDVRGWASMAMRSGNLKLLGHICDKHLQQCGGLDVWEVFQYGDHDVVELVGRYPDVLSVSRHPDLPIGVDNPFEKAFHETLFRAAANDEHKEHLLLSLWKALNISAETCDQELLNQGLMYAGQISASIPHGEFLIRAGANIDGPPGDVRRNPLRYVLKAPGTLRRAEFIRFLLSKGARPRELRGSTILENLKGAQTMEHYLGITWHELLEQTQGDRQD